MPKRQGNNPKRRIIPRDALDPEDLERLAREARYVGSPYHKSKPADYRFTPPTAISAKGVACLRVLRLAVAGDGEARCSLRADSEGGGGDVGSLKSTALRARRGPARGLGRVVDDQFRTVAIDDRLVERLPVADMEVEEQTAQLLPEILRPPRLRQRRPEQRAAYLL